MRQTRLFDHVARIGVQLLPVAERVPAGGRPINGWSSYASPRGGATMPEQYNPNSPAGKLEWFGNIGDDLARLTWSTPDYASGRSCPRTRPTLVLMALSQFH
jgi:hypothetical protein